MDVLDEIHGEFVLLFQLMKTLLQVLGPYFAFSKKKIKKSKNLWKLRVWNTKKLQGGPCSAIVLPNASRCEKKIQGK